MQPRLVAADQHLIGLQHRISVDMLAADHLGVTIAAALEVTAFPHGHGELNDRVVGRLAVDLGEHEVRLIGREEAGALHRRELERIAQHQHLGAEAEQVSAKLLIHHRNFVDDDEVGVGGRGFVVEHEARFALLLADQGVDQRMDGLGTLAAALAHDQRRFAGECGVFDRLDVLRQVDGERRLAGAGPAEQAENLRTVAILEPFGDGDQRRVLLR